MFWNGDYGFFDYKYNIDYHGEDYDGFGRWFYLIVSVVSIVLLLVFLRKTKKENVIKYLKIMSILLMILEITKISFESYWDIKTGRGFNKEGLIPLYTCSLFMYVSLLAGFTKGKVQDCCLGWLSTIGIVGGTSNLIFIQGLKWYPFWTFCAFYSMIFHYLMVFTGLFIAITRTKTFEWIDIFKAYIPHIIFSSIVIPINYKFGWDYMQYYDAGGVPVFDDLINRGKMFDIPFLGVLAMLFMYLALDAMFVTIFKLSVTCSHYLIMNDLK